MKVIFKYSTSVSLECNVLLSSKRSKGGTKKDNKEGDFLSWVKYRVWANLVDSGLCAWGVMFCSHCLKTLK